jgi:predicted transposase YdaD
VARQAAGVDDIDLSAQPNDGYFKAVFSDPERAAMFFRAHLPPALAAQIDWPSLAVVPGSFVKQSLQQTHSDLLFSAKVGGRELLLYLLFEHQTTVDPAMPLRLLGYMLEILQAQHEQRGLPLSPVLPFVLHQGPDRWTVSPCFEELFELPEELAPLLLPYLPKFRHALLDLTQLDPDRDEDQDQMRLVLQLMKLARLKRLAEWLAWIAVEMARLGWAVPLPLVRLSYNYAIHSDEKIDLPDIARSLALHPELKESIMSLAQKLKAEGQAEGRTEGIAIGAARAKVQLLERILQKPATAEDALASLSLEELERRYAELDREYSERFKNG